MAKTDNLNDFLKDIADAIREKTGKIEPINAQDFANEIKNTSDNKDVTFYDYDGTVLYSYSKKDFLALTEFPPLPERANLICQEWNWDFITAQTYVSTYGSVDIGATYITDDGKTRIYIKLYYPTSLAITTSANTQGDTIIDWGDGTIETYKSSYTNVYHTYSNAGNYIIKVNGTNGYHGFWSNIIDDDHRGCITGIHTGNMIDFRQANLPNLEFITLSKNTLNDTYSAIKGLSKIETLILPNNIRVVSNAGDFVNDCYNLKVVVPPSYQAVYRNYLCNNTMIINKNPFNYDAFYSNKLSPLINNNSIYQSIYNNNNSISLSNTPVTNIIVPEGVTSLSTFEKCTMLETISLPTTITTLSGYCFANCKLLKTIKIPASLKTINDSVFSNCTGMRYYDFSESTSVVTLGSTYVFNSYPKDCKIIVPDNLYDEWIAATNWSTYAKYIMKKSDWDIIQ